MAKHRTQPPQSRSNAVVDSLKLQKENEALKEELSVLKAGLEEEKSRVREEIRQNAEAIRDELLRDERDQLANEADILKAEREEFKSEIENRRRQLEQELATEREGKLECANIEAKLVLQIASEQAEEILSSAKTKAEMAFETEREALTIRTQQLEKKESDQTAERRRLRQLQDELEFDRTELDGQRTKLNERWQKCSPGRVEELVQIVESQRETESALREALEELRKDMSKLKRMELKLEGASFEEIVRQLDYVRSKCRELEERLAILPTQDRVAELEAEERLGKEIRIRNEELQRALEESEARAVRLQNARSELECARLERESLKAINNHLETLVNNNKAMYDNRATKRFPGLCAIDDDLRDPPRELAKEVNLENLVTGFCQYAANLDLPLFYSEEQVRTFLGSMAASRLIILQGLSGTGKSSLPRCFAEFLGGENRLIPVQSSWRDRNELLGYHNDFNNRFRETEFTKAVYEGGTLANSDRLWIVTLDEMNLSRVEYYFSDFISKLELPDERWEIPLIEANLGQENEVGPRLLADGHRLTIGRNVWFVGTANRDESTFEITDKVYDRAQVLDFRRRHDENPKEKGGVKPTSVTALTRAFKSAKAKASNALSPEEWGYIHELDIFLSEGCGISFGNRIQDQIKNFVPVYAAAGGAKGDAVDHQIATKILRKLDSVLDQRSKEFLTDFETQLGLNSFGWKMKQSHDLVGIALGRRG